MVKWTERSWRASMTDVTEYNAYFYDKTKNIPYHAEVSIDKRDSGITEYTCTIQGRVAEEIRGWWMTKTFFRTSGTTRTPKKVVENMNKVISTLGSGFVNISMEDYTDWSDNHPIKKHRRVGSDWGIYATSRTSSEKGWFDKVYGTIYAKNSYATRYPTQADAKKDADKLAKNNPGWKFEVKQMGKTE